MTQIKYKGRKISLAKTKAGWLFEVKRGTKSKVSDTPYARMWTAKRGAVRAINRKEA